MNLIIATAILSLGAVAFAALPPYYDSVKQLEAVMQSRLVVEKLGAGTAIESVSKMQTTEGGIRYLVRNDSECGVAVDLEAHVPKQPGPTTYTVKTVSNLMCE